MAFKWTAHAVEIAAVLAQAGFSASEAALVLNTSKSSILSRSSRKKEFQFFASSRGTPMPEEELTARLREAQELAKGVAPPAEPRPPIPLIPRKQMLALKGKRGKPVVARSNVNVEKPLTSAERQMIFANDGTNPESVPFHEMKEHHCRWIVTDVDGMNTMVCGRKREEESSYCEHHLKRSISIRQPKRVSYDKSLDQNIALVESGKEKSSSLQKKS